MIDERRKILQQYGITLYDMKYPNKIISNENSWFLNKGSVKSDIKLLTSILNKLTTENLDIMIVETKKLNYKDDKLIELLFTKAINEPFYSELYAIYCKNLPDLFVILNEKCSEKFKLQKHKNLCRFIGYLYNFKIIKNIDCFFDILIDDLSEINLDIILELIKNQKNYSYIRLNDININSLKEPYNRIRCEVLISKIQKYY